MTVCRADTIQINSGVSPNEYNNQTGTNVIIQPNPVWATASGAYWISYANTGMDGIIAPNATGNTPTASFYQDFYLTGGNNRAVGDFTVWADDTASVYIDNTPLILRNQNLGMYCSAGAIGCTQVNGANLHFDILANPGTWHSIRFDVFQQWGDVYGLLYKGLITLSDPPPPVTPTPEPGTLGVMIGALFAGTAFARKRWQAQSSR
jgi:hypothetical protein